VVVVVVAAGSFTTVVQEVKVAISAAGIRRISVFIVESLCRQFGASVGGRCISREKSMVLDD
jgi:hypothetical protein